MPVELPPEEDRPGVPIAPPLLFVLPLLIFFLLEWAFPTALVHGAVRWNFGGITSAAGIALSVCGFVTQKRAGTDPLPFNPSTRIVSHGIYRWTRNPMYVGFVLVTLGVAVLLNSAWMLLAVPIGIFLTRQLIIVREERYLERKF